MRPEDLYLFDENEKPLDRLVTDGGFCGIFRRIGCIGDSLASGEFESKRADGSTGFHDMYEYSWGSYIGRDTGAEIVNMGRDLMTAEEFVTSYAGPMHFFDPANACQAYIIALGVNDLFTKGGELGSIDDVSPDDPDSNAKNFAGYMGKLLSKLKAISPRCRLFLVSMPHQECEGCWNPTVEAHRDLLLSSRSCTPTLTSSTFANFFRGRTTRSVPSSTPEATSTRWGICTWQGALRAT